MRDETKAKEVGDGVAVKQGPTSAHEHSPSRQGGLIDEQDKFDPASVV